MLYIVFNVLYPETFLYFITVKYNHELFSLNNLTTTAHHLIKAKGTNCFIVKLI